MHGRFLYLFERKDLFVHGNAFMQNMIFFIQIFNDPQNFLGFYIVSDLKKNITCDVILLMDIIIFTGRISLFM